MPGPPEHLRMAVLRHQEIAIELGVDLAEVTQALLAHNAYHTQPIDTRGGEDSESAPIVDTYGAEDPRYELAIQTMVAAPLLAGLTELDRRVLYLRFFGGQSQLRIAETVGVSQMHISRMLTRIMGELRAAAQRQ
ncbi:sigma factor-like helix-turn-helix DNA-binding protein [Nocardia takedensis]|uniref:sigma factor-like helix-turn-helix DNA-binding protein n=1 Tax=Nocardia takedensis TaxID=259390 RepID=UPI003F77615B